jgi:hypothetical protein
MITTDNAEVHDYTSIESRMLRLIALHTKSAVAFVQHPGFPLLLAALELELPRRPNTMMFVMSKLKSNSAVWSQMPQEDRERVDRCLALLKEFHPQKGVESGADPYKDIYMYEKLTDGVPSAAMFLAAITVMSTSSMRGLPTFLITGTAIGLNYAFRFVCYVLIILVSTLLPSIQCSPMDRD